MHQKPKKEQPPADVMLIKKLVPLNSVISILSAEKAEYIYQLDYLNQEMNKTMNDILCDFQTKMSRIECEYQNAKSREEKLNKKYQLKYQMKFEGVLKKSAEELKLLKAKKDNSRLIERKIQLMSNKLKPIVDLVNSIDISKIDSIVTNMKRTIDQENRKFNFSLTEFEKERKNKFYKGIKALIIETRTKLLNIRSEVENGSKELYSLFFTTFADQSKKNRQKLDQIIQPMIRKEVSMFEEEKTKMTLENNEQIKLQRMIKKEVNDEKTQKTMKYQKEIDGMKNILSFYKEFNFLMKQHNSFQTKLNDFAAKNKLEIEQMRITCQEQKDIAKKEIEILYSISDKNNISNLCGPNENSMKSSFNEEFESTKNRLNEEYQKKKEKSKIQIENLKKLQNNEIELYSKSLNHEKEIIYTVLSEFEKNKTMSIKEMTNPSFILRTQLAALQNKLQIMKNKVSHDKMVFLNKIEYIGW